MINKEALKTKNSIVKYLQGLGIIPSFADAAWKAQDLISCDGSINKLDIKPFQYPNQHSDIKCNIFTSEEIDELKKVAEILYNVNCNEYSSTLWLLFMAVCEVGVKYGLKAKDNELLKAEMQDCGFDIQQEEQADEN